MGGVVTKIFDYAGDVVDLIGSSFRKFGELLQSAANVLRDIKNIFGSPAQIPREINKSVTEFERNIGKKQSYLLIYWLYLSSENMNKKEAARRLRDLAEQIEDADD